MMQKVTNKHKRAVYLDVSVVEASVVSFSAFDDASHEQGWLGMVGNLMTAKHSSDPDLYCVVCVFV
jgi:hypothetical protein